ncbi:MAG: tRNA pseudouridine(38-40) synthase TruA, partial [Bacilli bacterium]|nr:tRNA pseudouridine(38-40) synthase TruA [Bacilli bacterium]
MRYLMTISYDGSKYNGYQKQLSKRTVQNELEKAITLINGNKQVIVCASGRTDRGVHALNQKVHFDLDKKMDVNRLCKAINSIIPNDIYVKNVEVVDDSFHARFNVKAKEYIYKINMGEYNPIQKDYVYQYNKKLDLVEMERALKYFEGEHNFKSFVKGDDKRYDYVRKIVTTYIHRDIKNVNIITISITGTGFMRYMVRNIVGFLIEIGEGKRKSEDLIEVLKEENRTKAGITAPPEGLYLKDVFY